MIMLKTLSRSLSGTLPEYDSSYCNNHIVTLRPAYNDRKEAENL